jgi:hypothetical protein
MRRGRTAESRSFMPDHQVGRSRCILLVHHPRADSESNNVQRAHILLGLSMKEKFRNSDSICTLPGLARQDDSLCKRCVMTNHCH